MPDLTRRLSAGDAQPGMKVDIVPHNGSVVCMASRSGIAVIQEPSLVNPPTGVTANFSQQPHGTVLVKIETILAPSLLVPGKSVNLFELLYT